MPLIRDAVSSLLTRAPNTERLPVGPTQRVPSLITGAGRGEGSSPQHLAAMGNTGWLFAVVDRIATSTAAAEWKLYQTARNGERTQLEQHPALDLWNSANPFYTREEFLETSQQHFELVGESWWVLIRPTPGAPPVEMWAIRPDRIRPIPHRTEYISGYIYRMGSESIPLDREDVVFIRRPNPLNPYRGIGPIQSIYSDLESERQSATYNAAFFRNSAEPGGIIQVDEPLSDDEFDRLRSQWQLQHQGVSNAHRVAILERGTWVDRKITQRDMQFEQLRRLNRDIILGAFGFPASLLGIAENVNRANAEAAEVMFARWLIKPRLERIKAVVNERLMPLFGDGLIMDYVDPTPENREFNLQAANDGYAGGYLTKNESRGLVGYGEVDKGDEFAPVASGGFFGDLDFGSTPVGDTPEAESEGAPVQVDVERLALNGAQVQALLQIIQEVTLGQLPPDAAKALIHAAFPSLSDEEIDQMVDDAVSFVPDAPVGETGKGRSSKARNKDADDADASRESHQAKIRRNWTRRLETEREAIIEHLGQYFARGVTRPRTKLELSDVDAYDWDWWNKYGDEVVEELTDAFEAAILRASPNLPAGEARRLAAQYADTRGARLLREDGDMNMAAMTRQRVNGLVAENIRTGEGLGTLQKALREDLAFEPARAERVARTETATALGHAKRTVALADGEEEKRWVSQGDQHVSVEICAANEAEGWVEITQPFQCSRLTPDKHSQHQGHDTIPGHINCRCTVIYRTRDTEFLTEARCPTCHKLLQRNVPSGLTLWCPRCKLNQTIGELTLT